MRQGGADDDDEEEEQVQNVPPLSSFLSTAKIGWKFAKWPEGRFGYGYRHGSRSDDDDDKDDPYLRMFKINSAVVAVLLFWIRFALSRLRNLWRKILRSLAAALSWVLKEMTPELSIAMCMVKYPAKWIVSSRVAVHALCPAFRSFSLCCTH